MKSLFLTIFSIYIVANLYVGYNLWQIIPANLLARTSIVTMLAIGFAAPLIFFAYGESLPINIAGTLYKVGTSWMIAFLYLFIFVLLIDLFKLSAHLFGFISKDTILEVFKHNGITSIILFGITSLILIAGNINYHNKRRVHLPISSSKVDNPMRIVAISDLHLGYTIGKKELSNWVKLINDEKPDMVLIAGDLIDNQLRPVTYQFMHQELQNISAPLGVFACTGNHEFISGIKESTNLYKSANINLLRDSYVEVNGVSIVGRDDYSNHGRADLSEIVNGIDSNKFTILLDHQPNNLDVAVDYGIDLQLSGHTHHGQIFPGSLITNKLFEVSHGYKQKGNTHVYVSSGLGIWGGKFRIGTQSEYVVIDLTKE